MSAFVFGFLFGAALLLTGRVLSFVVMNQGLVAGYPLDTLGRT